MCNFYASGIFLYRTGRVSFSQAGTLSQKRVTNTTCVINIVFMSNMCNDHTVDITHNLCSVGNQSDV